MSGANLQSLACSFCFALIDSCPGLQLPIRSMQIIIIIACNVRFRICVWVLYTVWIRLLFVFVFLYIEYSCCKGNTAIIVTNGTEGEPKCKWTLHDIRNEYEISTHLSSCNPEQICVLISTFMTVIERLYILSG